MLYITNNARRMIMNNKQGKCGWRLKNTHTERLKKPRKNIIITGIPTEI
jgi:hypothetical protein